MCICVFCIHISWYQLLIDYEKYQVNNYLWNSLNQNEKIDMKLISYRIIPTINSQNVRTLRCSGVGGGTLRPLSNEHLVTPKHYGINIKQHASRSSLCKHIQVLYSHTLHKRVIVTSKTLIRDERRDDSDCPKVTYEKRSLYVCEKERKRERRKFIKQFVDFDFKLLILSYYAIFQFKTICNFSNNSIYWNNKNF